MRVFLGYLRPCVLTASEVKDVPFDDSMVLYVKEPYACQEIQPNRCLSVDKAFQHCCWK